MKIKRVMPLRIRLGASWQGKNGLRKLKDRELVFKNWLLKFHPEVAARKGLTA